MPQVSAAPAPATDLPPPRDSETLFLLRAFLRPLLDQATSWDDLSRRLARRGYKIAFRDGRLVILDESQAPLCTGRCLGVPLRALAARLGRPHVRADRTGRGGALH